MTEAARLDRYLAGLPKLASTLSTLQLEGLIIIDTHGL